VNIPIFNTFIHPTATEIVSEVLQSTFLSEGEIVKKFEAELSTQLGITNCVTLNSGTSALHLALVLAGVDQDDEVIIPAQTFVATGLAILQQKAKVVFADINYETGNISVASVKDKITPHTKAIMPVHWGGYPCDMDELNAVAKENNLCVIEDAAHALGAIYKGKFVGQLSEFACFSFQAIKHLTTGDGGCISVEDTLKHKEALTRRWFGIDRDNAVPSELGERKYDISLLGFKYHLNNYGAALGLANLNGYHQRLENRRKIADYYYKELSTVDGISLFEKQTDRQSAYWLFGMHVENRRGFVRSLKEAGITASVIHQRIDRNSIFGGVQESLINQTKFDETQIHIPIHDGIDMEKAEYIVNNIKRGWS